MFRLALVDVASATPQTYRYYSRNVLSMRDEDTTNDPQHRPRQSLQFRLSFLFFITFGAAVLFTFGRSLGVQFVLYVIGLIGFLAAPAVFQKGRAAWWKMMAASLVGLAWFLAWIMLACWVVRSGN